MVPQMRSSSTHWPLRQTSSGPSQIMPSQSPGIPPSGTQTPSTQLPSQVSGSQSSTGSGMQTRSSSRQVVPVGHSTLPHSKSRETQIFETQISELKHSAPPHGPETSGTHVPRTQISVSVQLFPQSPGSGRSVQTPSVHVWPPGHKTVPQIKSLLMHCPFKQNSSTRHVSEPQFPVSGGMQEPRRQVSSGLQLSPQSPVPSSGIQTLLTHRPSHEVPPQSPTSGPTQTPARQVSVASHVWPLHGPGALLSTHT